MTDYMLIYKGGDPAWATRTADEKKAVMAKWGAWFGQLAARGKLVTGGSPLAFDGRRLNKDGVVTDIAASELKELVSGYSVIKAESYDEATALARECPILQNAGALIEIRTIIAM